MSGFNFVHDGLIKNNIAVYFYAGKGNWEQFHELPKGEYPLCSIDPSGNVELLNIFNTYGRLFSPLNGNYIIIGNFIHGPDELIVFDVRNKKNKLILKNYKVIGELNETQSLIYNKNNEIYIFDHNKCAMKKIGCIEKDCYIVDIESNEGDSIKEWDAITSSIKKKIIILRGYTNIFGIRKETLFIYKYNNINKSFDRKIKYINTEHLISAIVINDNSFYYQFD